MHRSSAGRAPRATILFVVGIFVISFLGILPRTSEEASAQSISRTSPTPLAVSTKHATSTKRAHPGIRAQALIPPAPVNQNNTSPARLVIPSIGLNAPIVGVGVNAAGEMAVPNGKTNKIGWYNGGPVPGGVGAAVLDAHVFAAFSKLKNLKPGDDIYVVTAGNQRLHFVVSAARLFALSSLHSDMLFTQTNTRDLNLITCAGLLTPDHSTYDHRLIVYTTLAS